MMMVAITRTIVGMIHLDLDVDPRSVGSMSENHVIDNGAGMHDMIYEQIHELN